MSIPEIIKRCRDFNQDGINCYFNPDLDDLYDALEEELSKDTEILNTIDELEVFHIDKNHSGIKRLRLCLCDKDHQEFEADNIRDLITKAKER